LDIHRRFPITVDQSVAREPNFEPGTRIAMAAIEVSMAQLIVRKLGETVKRKQAADR
jgi:hypothetical protein